MFTRRSFSSLFTCLFLVPTITSAAAIQANITCEFGNCNVPGTLSPGGTTSGADNFVYTFSNGDQYYVMTTYSATDTPLTISFSVDAVYTGNNGNATVPSVGGDILNVDLLEYFATTSSSTVSFSSSATLIQQGTAGSYSNAELFFDGQGTGFAGNYFGPTLETVTTAPTEFSGIFGNPTSGDYDLTFYFAPGTPSSATPEPTSFSMFLLVALAALSVGYRRCRTWSVTTYRRFRN